MPLDREGSITGSTYKGPIFGQKTRVLQRGIGPRQARHGLMSFHTELCLHENQNSFHSWGTVTGAFRPRVGKMFWGHDFSALGIYTPAKLNLYYFTKLTV